MSDLCQTPDCLHAADKHRLDVGLCAVPDCMCVMFRKTYTSLSYPEKRTDWTCSDCGEDQVDEDGVALHMCSTDLVVREFVLAMCKILRGGVKDGRTFDDWQELSPEAARAKIYPLLRHMGKHQFDAVACNAMIMWWHFQRNKESE